MGRDGERKRKRERERDCQSGRKEVRKDRRNEAGKEGEARK